MFLKSQTSSYPCKTVRKKNKISGSIYDNLKKNALEYSTQKSIALNVLFLVVVSDMYQIGNNKDRFFARNLKK